jgi:hypothetical protein
MRASPQSKTANGSIEGIVYPLNSSGVRRAGGRSKKLPGRSTTAERLIPPADGGADAARRRGGLAQSALGGFGLIRVAASSAAGSVVTNSSVVTNTVGTGRGQI